MIYKALLSPVKGRGVPPVAFLNELVAWLKQAPDEIFTPNDDPEDVFNRLHPLLGPWASLLHRRAAMGELLRCLAGFESSWDWKCGVDTTNKTSMRLIIGQETGIFQVSFDSLFLDMVGDDKDDDLHRCVKRHCGKIEVQRFIDMMKTDHSFAFEYCARLLRNSFYWDGPIKRHEIDSSLNRKAVAELMPLISSC